MAKKNKIKIRLNPTLDQYLSFKYADPAKDFDGVIDRLREVDEYYDVVFNHSWDLPPYEFAKNMRNLVEAYIYFDDYNPKKVECQIIGGEKFTIPKKLTVQESIEARQQLWMWANNKSEDPIEQRDLMFEHLLRISAIVLQSKNKPKKYNDFMTYIERTADLFQQFIYSDTAFTCLNIATEHWDNMEKKPWAKYFFNPPDTREKDPKARVEIEKINREVFNRVGYRSIYPRLEKSEAWSDKDKANYVKNLWIEEAVTQLSIENSVR